MTDDVEVCGEFDDSMASWWQDLEGLCGRCSRPQSEHVEEV